MRKKPSSTMENKWVSQMRDKHSKKNSNRVGSSIIEMYRMTKAEMENEITSLKRGPDRTTRRPPLLHHEPPMSNVPNRNSPHLLPTPSNFHPHHRHSGSPGNNNSNYPMQGNFNQDSSFVCLRLRNIPYTTSEQQIYEYFASISVQIEECKLLLDRFNRGAGEALIRFADPQACQLAYESKNRQIFYGRTLDLRLVSLNEFQNASLTRMLPVNDLGSNQQRSHGMNNSKRYSSYYERADDERRNDKRARWDGGHSSNKGKTHHFFTTKEQILLQMVMDSIEIPLAMMKVMRKTRSMIVVRLLHLCHQQLIFRHYQVN